MGLLSGLMGKARMWLEGRRLPLPKEKTLTELMAEKGLNEFGRAGQAPAPAQQAADTGGYQVKFVTEFSIFDRPEKIRLSVVALDNREFQGICAEGGDLQTFSWGKVRGLMKIVDTGKMLSPYEAYDLYH